MPVIRAVLACSTPRPASAGPTWHRQPGPAFRPAASGFRLRTTSLAAELALVSLVAVFGLCRTSAFPGGHRLSSRSRFRLRLSLEWCLSGRSLAKAWLFSRPGAVRQGRPGFFVGLPCSANHLRLLYQHYYRLQGQFGLINKILLVHFCHGKGQTADGQSERSGRQPQVRTIIVAVTDAERAAWQSLDGYWTGPGCSISESVSGR